MLGNWLDARDAAFRAGAQPAVGELDVEGECLEGRWWGERGLICFRYDGPAQCWRFMERLGSFAAELVQGGAATGFVLELDGMDVRPLDCPGPGGRELNTARPAGALVHYAVRGAASASSGCIGSGFVTAIETPGI